MYTGLPEGTLTYLFTDVEGSTILWEHYPEQMRMAMIRHDAIIEQCVNQAEGFVVRPRGEGDSRFAVFCRATDAINATTTIQRGLAAEPWTIPGQLRVRIALHTGEADLRAGDYYGSVVNRCARLRSVAHGGQTLISQATQNLVQDELPEGIRLRDLGEHKLKDLVHPEHIYQLDIAGLECDFPPLRTQEGYQTNLPIALTSFIGREREVAEVKRLILSTRLLTITGMGGCGKTRLATHVALELLDNFPHGVWFIDLTPLTRVELVPQHLLVTLGVREELGIPVVHTLVNYLRDKRILLLLDNCEHLIKAVSQLTETILRGAPSLKILATSREPVGILGEVIWSIPTLATPDLRQAQNCTHLCEFEAVQLFVARAEAVKTGFQLTDENAPFIAEICAHLDGIPLAIELAAARIRVLSVEEIAIRLKDRFKLLVGYRTAQQRQETLQALIDWSYDLLLETERALLRRLSVFAGTWTVSAAERICSGGIVEEEVILDLLSHLIDKSFVITESSNGEKRFRFLETIHAYSHMRLQAHQEVDIYSSRHAAYFLNLAEISFPELWGDKQEFWLCRLEDDYDNMRKALEWMTQDATRKELLLRMAGALWRYWEVRGYFDEGRKWLTLALEVYSDAPAPLRANALRGLGILALQQGDYPYAKRIHTEGLRLFQEIGDRLGIARQIEKLGEVAYLQGQYAEAVEHHTDSLAQHYEIGDKEGMVVALIQLGIIARERGQYQHAKDLLEESLKLSREIKAKQLTAMAVKNLGSVAHYLCDYPSANILYKEALEIYYTIDDKLGITNILLSLGETARDQGNFKKANELLQECLEMKQGLGDRRGIAQVIAGLGEISFYQGNYLPAAELVERSMRLFQELGVKRGIILCLGLLAFINFYQGDYRSARRFTVDCLALASEIKAPRPIAYCKEVYGLLAYASSDYEKAHELFLESLEIFEKVGDLRNMITTRINLARVAYRKNNLDYTVDILRDCIALSKKLEIHWVVSYALEIQGLVERSRENQELALKLFYESLLLSVEQDNRQGIANCLGAIAGLKMFTDHLRQSIRLFAAADRIRDEINAKMSEPDQKESDHYLEEVRKRIDETAFQEAWLEGRTVELDKILSELSNYVRDDNDI